MTEISDEKVLAATGRDWAAWLKWLDAKGAKTMAHKEIVTLLKPEEMSPWYRQTITVTYEQKRQGRQSHETVDGFEISASKTIAAPPHTVEAAFLTHKYGPAGILDISTHHKGKTIRGAWSGKMGGRLNVYLYDLENGKCRITLNHVKLSNASDGAAVKTAWRDGLSKMKSDLEA